MTLENVYIKKLLHHTLLIRKLQVQPRVGSAKTSYLDRCTFKHHLKAITSTSLAFFRNYCKIEDWTQVGGNMELGAVKAR